MYMNTYTRSHAHKSIYIRLKVFKNHCALWKMIRSSDQINILEKENPLWECDSWGENWCMNRNLAYEEQLGRLFQEGKEQIITFEDIKGRR